MARTEALCPACGATGLDRWREAVSPDPGAPRFVLLCCPRCGSAAVAGARVSASNSLFAENRPSPRAIDRVRHLLVRERLRFVRGMNGRALEIGAGDGTFLALLKRRGWEVDGVEPYGGPSNVARTENVELERTTVERMERAARYDLVVLWHVLEHLADPAAALALVRRCITDGGSLLVAVPNRRSIQAAIGGDRWFHQDVPRHAIQFTPSGLDSLLHRCGFAIQRRFRLVFDQNVFGMWQTILNLVTREPNVAYRLLGGRGRSRGRPSRTDAVLTAIASVPALVVVAAMEPAAGLIGRGGTIVVAASPQERAGG